EAAEQLFVERLQAPGARTVSQSETALTLVALGDLAPSTAALDMQILLQTMTTSKDAQVVASVMKALPAVAVQMDANVAANSLVEQMTKTNNPQALRALAESTSLVAARLEPDQNARVADAAGDVLTQALTEASDREDRQVLATGLSAV